MFYTNTFPSITTSSLSCQEDDYLPFHNAPTPFYTLSRLIISTRSTGIPFPLLVRFRRVDSSKQELRPDLDIPISRNREHDSPRCQSEPTRSGRRIAAIRHAATFPSHYPTTYPPPSHSMIRFSRITVETCLPISASKTVDNRNVVAQILGEKFMTLHHTGAGSRQQVRCNLRRCHNVAILDLSG